MERLRSEELGRGDTPQQFSVSAIGSPAAFSTAVKLLPGSPSNLVQNGHSPFLNPGQAHEESPQPNG